MFTRRHFIHIAGPAVLIPAALSGKTMQVKTLPLPQSSSEQQKVNMYVGTQKSCTSEMLQFYKRCGVNHICGIPEKWTMEDLLALKERCSKNGIKLDMVPIGLPRSVGFLGNAAYRDRQIEQTCNQIRLAAKAGIPTIKYNLYVFDVLRTGTTPGRGGSRYSTWEYEKASLKNH